MEEMSKIRTVMHACVWQTGHGLEQGSMDKFEVYEILGKQTNNKATPS